MGSGPDHASPRGPGPSSSPANRRTTRRGELQRCHSTHAGVVGASWRVERGGEGVAGEQVGDELFGLAPEEFVAARDELFGLAPEEFVAARDELARRLRREGDPEAAGRVKALRRPPLSAWAVNQLARGKEPSLDRLLAAGERLRAAQQAALAGGDAAELRSAAKAEREAVAGLVAAALDRLRQAGHPATDATRGRVAATLHAAAASPEAADLVRHGRLTADLDPSGFGAASGAVAEGDGDRAGAAEDDAATLRARRAAALAARDDARKRAR